MGPGPQSSRATRHALCRCVVGSTSSNATTLGTSRTVDGVEAAISAARDRAGDRIVDVAGGEIGGQALRLGLIDQVVVNLVPALLGR